MVLWVHTSIVHDTFALDSEKAPMAFNFNCPIENDGLLWGHTGSDEKLWSNNILELLQDRHAVRPSTGA